MCNLNKIKIKIHYCFFLNGKTYHSPLISLKIIRLKIFSKFQHNNLLFIPRKKNVNITELAKQSIVQRSFSKKKKTIGKRTKKSVAGDRR